MAEERMLNDEILLGLIKANSGGGGGGTTDYDDLSNKPQINGTTLTGNKSASDLSLASTADLAGKVDKAEGKGLSTNDYTDADKAIVGGVTAALAGKQDALTAGANINMTGDVVKAGVVEVVEPDMTVYGNSTESGSKTYTIETTGVYEIFYCLSLQSTVSVTLPNNVNVLFESDLTVSSHPVKHIVAELHEGDTVTIAQTPSQWNAVVSGVLKLDAISVVDVAHTGSIADSTITYTLPNDNKYYLVVGACVGKPTGNNAVDSTSGGNPDITRTLTGTGVRFRSVVVKGSDSPSFSFYGYDGGVASIIAYEIEFEEGNWDYNLATKNYVDTAIGAAVASAYHHAGTKTCAELVAGLLVAGNEGNVYNMTDSGTTTADFIEGAGQPIKAGDNVGIAKISDGVYKFDLLSGFVDTTNFVQKSQTAGLLKNDGTVDTTIQGDVSTLKSGLTDLSEEVNGDATTYPYADVITIEDAIPANVADCNVKIEPVQDLHGYDHPWVGGAGKNILPMTLAGIKAVNTNVGTWSGNTYTFRGISFEVKTDADGNVTSIVANGTSEADFASINIADLTLPAGSYIISGSVDGASSSWRVSFGGNIISYDGDSAFTLDESRNGMVQAIIRMSGTTVENLVFKPMIRLATETDATFAPYTNVCPITGHTEASVQGDGRNLFDVSTITTGKGIAEDSGIVDSSVSCVSDYIRVMPNTNYYLTARDDGGSRRIGFYDQYKNNLQASSAATGSRAFTTPANCAYCRISVNTSYADETQLELGSTATPYVPYAGKTYTHQFGDTIFGGEDNFVSGDVSVTMGYYKPSSASDIYSNSGNFPTREFVIYPSPAGKQNGKLISNMFTKISSGTTAWGAYITGAGSIRLNSDSTYNSAQDAYDELLKDAEFVYELATPTNIQLTPTQIQLLQGQNTLTASTGDISVTVNGVSGSIGAVQEQVNELAETVTNTQTTVQVSTNAVEVDSSYTFDVDEYAKAFTIMVSRYGIADSITVTHELITSWNNNNELYFVTGSGTNHVILKMQYNGSTKKCTATVKESTIAGMADTAVFISVVTMY